MKIFSVLLFCAAVVALLPAQAQGRRSRTATPAAAAASAEEAAPKNGVRFVICSPTGLKMPSPLYVRSGKEFKAISIGSRTPSVRVKPVNGVVDFWDKDPSPKMEEGDKKPKAASEKLPEPIFSISVPASAGNKSVCILSPNKEVKKTGALFLNESEFPKKGMHVINLSSFPLQIVTSTDLDFKDKKEYKVGVYRREDGICPENSWSFKGDKGGQQVAFVLSYYDKATKGLKRIKASTFVVSERQSMVNVVVKDASRNIPKLMSIQIAEKDK